MQKEGLLEKRFLDLSIQADKKNIVLFSDFLNLHECNIFIQNRNQYQTQTILFGGYEYAERQIAAFIPDALFYEWNFPLVCLKLKAAYPKFADTLTHRDILGAIMNLGIERSTIGDILIQENQFYIFCLEKIAPFIIGHLEKVKHTLVKIETISGEELNIRPSFEKISGIITSNRLDNMVAFLCHCSRTQASNTISGGKVFVNSKEIYSNSFECKKGDILSIRQLGKFVFTDISGETKKGRLKIEFNKYV